MSSPDSPATSLMARYPAFAFMRFSRAKSLRDSNLIVTLLFALALILSAKLDHTLFMDGRPVGFLEHPAIIVFILAQAWLPISIQKALDSFLALQEKSHNVLSTEMIEQRLPKVQSWLQCTLLREDRLGRLLFATFATVGFALFAWNSYQNQLPLQLVGADFWDSISHPWGYWTTRVYKLYLWVFFAPAIVQIEVSLVIAVKNVLRSAARHGDLTLEPYHADGCGGVRVFIDSVLNPMIPVVFCASMLTLSACIVHQKYDLTTIGALILTCSLLIFVYLVPAATLRRCIALEKARQLGEVTNVQNRLYGIVTLGDNEPSKVSEAVGLINSLADVCKQIAGIPEWPQFSRVMKLIVIAIGTQLTPFAVEMVQKYAGKLRMLDL